MPQNAGDVVRLFIGTLFIVVVLTVVAAIGMADATWLQPQIANQMARQIEVDNEWQNAVNEQELRVVEEETNLKIMRIKSQQELEAEQAEAKRQAAQREAENEMTREQQALAYEGRMNEFKVYLFTSVGYVFVIALGLGTALVISLAFWRGVLQIQAGRVAGSPGPISTSGEQNYRPQPPRNGPPATRGPMPMSAASQNSWNNPGYRQERRAMAREMEARRREAVLEIDRRHTVSLANARIDGVVGAARPRAGEPRTTRPPDKHYYATRKN